MGRRSNSFLLSALILVMLSRASFAAVNRWSSQGPEGGGLVSAMVIDPLNDSVMYAGTLWGVYKSENGGDQWNPVSDGIWDLSISALAISAEDPLTLYAGTASAMVFKTTNGGQRWIELGGPVAGGIRGIVLTSRRIVVATTRGLFRSEDDGATWEAALPELTNSYIFFVAISPDGDLYAGASTGLFESRDGGKIWLRVNQGPAYAVAFARAGSVYVSSGAGIIKSVDRGQTWQFVSGVQGLFGTALHILESSRRYVGTTFGLLEYEEQGNAWVLVRNTLPGSGVTAIAGARGSSRIFVGTSTRGIFTKIENSTDWASADRGIKLAFTNDVAVSPLEPSKVYAATSAGVFKSNDSAQTWQKLSPGHIEANDVEIDPISPNIVYADEGNSLKKSTDEGATWKTINPNFRSGLAVAPSNPATLYAALADGMAKSVDGGETWTRIMTDMPFGYYAFFYGFMASAIAVDAHDAATVYVSQEEGFFKTTNGGARWSRVPSDQPVRALAIDPSDSSVVYRAAQRGVSKSRDGGSTWGSPSLSDHAVSALVVNPSSPSTIYAGTFGGEVYRSDDGGGEWQRFGGGLIAGATIQRLSTDPSGNYLYAATVAGLFGYRIADLEILSSGDDPSRLTRLLNALLEHEDDGLGSPGFVIPVVGLGSGANGTFFNTDLSLRNRRSIDQEVLLVFLAQGNSGGAPFFRLTLSPFEGQEVNIPDIVDRLGLSGLGALVVVAIDGSGELDPAASIEGSSRVCTQSVGRPPTCQSIGATRADLLAGHDTASAGGLRHDARFRTNVGIANLDSSGRLFRITASGERHNEVFDVFVPPFSLVQTAIPGGDYGELTVSVNTESASAPWVLYGSSVDNRSGASWTSVGIP